MASVAVMPPPIVFPVEDNRKRNSGVSFGRFSEATGASVSQWPVPNVERTATPSSRTLLLTVSFPETNVPETAQIFAELQMDKIPDDLGNIRVISRYSFKPALSFHGYVDQLPFTNLDEGQQRDRLSFIKSTSIKKTRIY